jgi:hypothetical protein
MCILTREKVYVNKTAIILEQNDSAMTYVNDISRIKKPTAMLIVLAASDVLSIVERKKEVVETFLDKVIELNSLTGSRTMLCDVTHFSTENYIGCYGMLKDVQQNKIYFAKNVDKLLHDVKTQHPDSIIVAFKAKQSIIRGNLAITFLPSKSTSGSQIILPTMHATNDKRSYYYEQLIIIEKSIADQFNLVSMLEKKFSSKFIPVISENIHKLQLKYGLLDTLQVKIHSKANIDSRVLYNKGARFEVCMSTQVINDRTYTVLKLNGRPCSFNTNIINIVDQYIFL